MDRKLRLHVVVLVIGFLTEEISSKDIKQLQASRNGEKDLVVHKRATTVSSAAYIYNRYKEQYKTEATYYGKYPVGTGACSLDPLSPMSRQPGWIRVAAGRDDFQNSLGCGMCVEIKGSGKGSGSDPVTGVTKAIVHDLCGGCAKGGFDLYIEGDGRWEVETKAIDCPTLPGQAGNIMFRFTGSNPWYVKLQARNTKVPVAGMEILKNGKYSCLKRTGDNYFVGDRLGTVSFPMTVRVTAVTGEQRKAVLPSMKNDQNIRSNVQFSGFAAGAGPSNIKCAGQGNKPPYPPGGMAPGEGGGPSPPLPPPGPLTPLPPSPSPAPTTGGGGAGGAAGSNFCANRKSGLYPDPDDCSGFIICNIGKAHRQKCAPPQLLRADTMNCDLPGRVVCGSRPRPNDLAQRFYLTDKHGSDYSAYMKGPAGGQESLSSDKKAVHDQANGHAVLYKPKERNKQQHG